MNPACPACGGRGLESFFTAAKVPVQSVVLINNRSAARNFPRGEIQLALCPECGFITNLRFEADRLSYGKDYESTQACSETFSRFHRELAQDLIKRYPMKNRHLIEIGCGQGEFLSLLCRIGGCRGTGFDPAYDAQRSTVSPGERITVHPEKVSPDRALPDADFICCKMTLEHIRPVAEFIGGIRKGLKGSGKPVVIFQVPDAGRILQERAFWDIYYEHCSYFSAGSLARLFRSCGFEVRNLRRVYAGQYLLIEAVPTEIRPDRTEHQTPEDMVKAARDFGADAVRSMRDWRQALAALFEQGHPPMLWGAGSKAVAFLTSLGIGDEISGVIDINPGKRGTFLPGTGHAVFSPEDLEKCPPDRIIVLNPIYMDEIRRDLQTRRLAPELISINQPMRALVEGGHP